MLPSSKPQLILTQPICRYSQNSVTRVCCHKSCPSSAFTCLSCDTCHKIHNHGDEIFCRDWESLARVISNIIVGEGISVRGIPAEELEAIFLQAPRLKRLYEAKVAKIRDRLKMKRDSVRETLQRIKNGDYEGVNGGMMRELVDAIESGTLYDNKLQVQRELVQNDKKIKEIYEKSFGQYEKFEASGKVNQIQIQKSIVQKMMSQITIKVSEVFKEKNKLLTFLLVILLFSILTTVFRPYTDKELLQNASQLQYQNRSDKCLEAIKIFDQIRVKSHEAYFGRGYCHWDLGNFMEAQQDFTKAIDLSPQNATYFGYRSITRLELRKVKQGVEDCTKARKLQPNQPLYLSLQGAFQLYHHYWDAAEGSFTSSLRSSPTDARLFYIKAHFLKNFTVRGSYRERSLQAASVLVALSPNYRAYAERASIYQLMGRYAEAERDYTMALKLDDSRIGLWVKRAELLKLLKNYTEAISDCDHAIKIDSKYPYAYNLKGESYLDMGKYDLAVKELTKAIELFPKFKQAYLNRATAFAKLGRNIEASADQSIGNLIV